MKRCAPIVALAFVLLVLLLFLVPTPMVQATAAPFAQQAALAQAAPLPRLPVAAQSLVSATLGRDTPDYRALAAPDGYRFDNAAQHLTAEFDATGLRVSSGEFTFGLGLQAVGYAARLKAVVPTEPLAVANRVEYRRGELTEWYVNGPLGVEQGFTLAQPPAGERDGALTLSLAWSGNLEPTLEESGTGLVLGQGTTLTALRYTGLAAYDAAGQELRAWLELDRSGVSPSLQIRVEDAEARYPLTIDPHVLQATLTNSSGAANDSLGRSVAMSADGSTIVAGAWGVSGLRGAAYVFVRGAGSWATTSSPTAILSNSLGAANGSLGSSVAISADGSTLVAGAYGVNGYKGAAYIFAKGESGSWANTDSPTAILSNSSGAAWDYLGSSVAVSANGSTVVAGAYGVNDGRGAAYVFFQPTSNANLSNLSLSSGTLNPTFASATTSYTANVANGVTSLTVTPTAADTAATIQVRINGSSYAAVASGSASGALALNVGENTITVLVTAQDGTTTKTYSVTVTRANALLYLPLLLR